jgi:hypothetical protein
MSDECPVVEHVGDKGLGLKLPASRNPFTHGSQSQTHNKGRGCASLEHLTIREFWISLFSLTNGR